MKLRHWILLFLAPVASRAADTLFLADRGTFQINTPSGWEFSATRAADVGYSMALKPKADAKTKCLITLIYLDKPESFDRQKVEADTLKACEQYIAASVEKKANLMSFGVSKGYGAYCIFTDASLVGRPPQVDEYKVFATGLVHYTDDVIAVISMYCDDAKGSAMAAMVKAIGSSVVIPRNPVPAAKR